MTFDQLLAQYEPMISAHIRKLNIYRDFEQFRQVGRVALWQAAQRFDASKGDFTPFAYRTIRGAMLDELKRMNRWQERVVVTEDILLDQYVEKEANYTFVHEGLQRALMKLTPQEKQLLQWLFVEGQTYAYCAEQVGISISAIKKRRERLLQKMREIMQYKKD